MTPFNSQLVFLIFIRLYVLLPSKMIFLLIHSKMPTSKTVKSPKSTPKSVKQSKNTTRPKTTSKSVKPTSKSVQNKKKGGNMTEDFSEKLRTDDEQYEADQKQFNAKITDPTTIEHAFKNITTGIKQLQTYHTKVKQDAEKLIPVMQYFEKNRYQQPLSNAISGNRDVHKLLDELKNITDSLNRARINIQHVVNPEFTLLEQFNSNLKLVHIKMMELENENNNLKTEINTLQEKQQQTLRNRVYNTMNTMFKNPPK